MTDDDTSKKISDIISGASKFGVFRSLVPCSQKSYPPGDAKALPPKVAEILSADRAARVFIGKEQSTIINPLHVAYIRAVSRRAAVLDEKFATIIYPASSVDVVTPLLLLMCSQTKAATIYMVDINSAIQNTLRLVNDALLSNSVALPPEVTAKLSRLMYHQGYLLTAYDTSNVHLKADPYLILAFLLQKLGVKHVAVSGNNLHFRFQERDVVFSFIEGDITEPAGLASKIAVKKDDSYIVIEKATLDLSREKYFSAFCREFPVGKCLFLVNTHKLNKKYSGSLPYLSRERNLARQFLPNPCSQLQPVEHPLLISLHRGLLDISAGSPNLELTGYHLPVLHQRQPTNSAMAAFNRFTI